MWPARSGVEYLDYHRDVSNVVAFLDGIGVDKSI
jgi:hypothetical protein